MKIDKTKSTIISMVALIVICGGSFIAVKSLNSDSNVAKDPSVVTFATTVTTTQATTEPTTEATTMPTTESTTAQPTVDLNNQNDQNTITTFDVNATATTQADTTLAPVTVAPTTVAPTTTKAPTTTAPTTVPTTKPTTQAPTTEQEKADEVIKNAALFDNGFLSYMFDPDGKFYYTNKDPWQRAFGFNALYDIGAPLVIMFYDTMRCEFTYDEKDWLIQFWKGQYGYVFVGSEIGVYNKPTSRKLAHYDSASDADSLKMSLTTYRDGKELFTRDYGTYWWITGFVPGKLDSFADRSELVMKARITMKDYQMLLAFVNSLKENGLTLGKNFETKGLDVFVTY